jgi:hypothetical protein
MRLNRFDRFGEADIPQADLSPETVRTGTQAGISTFPHNHEKWEGQKGNKDALSSRQLPIPAPLHMHILHPRLMVPCIPPDHVLSRRKTAVVDSYAAVSEAGNEDVSCYLVAGHGG